MGDSKNLISEEAVNKLKELAKAEDICMFATNLSGRPVPVRPMSTQTVDDEGNLWFLSKSSSNKNREIKADAEVQLFYSNKESAEFLSVYGSATIMKDEAKAKELWTVFAKTWFTEGVDDPELTIIKVVPLEVYYWDTKHNKVVSLLKIIAGAITGKTMDDGIEGKLKV